MASAVNKHLATLAFLVTLILAKDVSGFSGRGCIIYHTQFNLELRIPFTFRLDSVGEVEFKLPIKPEESLGISRLDGLTILAQCRWCFDLP